MPGSDYLLLIVGGVVGFFSAAILHVIKDGLDSSSRRRERREDDVRHALDDLAPLIAKLLEAADACRAPWLDKPHLADALDRLGQALEGLQSRLHAHRVRLHPVMRDTLDELFETAWEMYCHVEAYVQHGGARPELVHFYAHIKALNRHVENAAWEYFEGGVPLPHALKRPDGPLSRNAKSKQSSTDA